MQAGPLGFHTLKDAIPPHPALSVIDILLAQAAALSQQADALLAIALQLKEQIDAAENEEGADEDGAPDEPEVELPAEFAEKLLPAQPPVFGAKRRTPQPPAHTP